MRTLTLAALCLIVFPASALAKGPTAATIEGPGLERPLTFEGYGAPGALGKLTVDGGLMPALFGPLSGSMLAKAPTGDLGPKYAVTYLVPGPSSTPDRIRQDLYPHASGGPFTFTPPGQRFFAPRKTHGGWFRGTVDLRTTLVAAGLPPLKQASPPAPARAPREESAGARTAATVGLGLLVVGLAGAAGLFVRRAFAAAA